MSAKQFLNRIEAVSEEVLACTSVQSITMVIISGTVLNVVCLQLYRGSNSVLFGVAGKRCLTWTKPRSCVREKNAQALDCTSQFVEHCIH